MRKILVVLALLTCVGCTKYKPYVNSPQEHLLMGDHLPLNVQDNLRPMYRSCTPEEIVDLKTDQQIEQRQYKCSAVIAQHDDRLHLVNWEAPADISGQPQGALAAGFAALRAARKYNITAGTLSHTSGIGQGSDMFQFCEIHPTDSDGMHWEEGKCWNSPTASASVRPAKETPPTAYQPPPAHADEGQDSWFLANGDRLYMSPQTQQPRLFKNKNEALQVLAGLTGAGWSIQTCDPDCQNKDSRFFNADWR